MKTITFAAFFLLLSMGLHSQDFNVPENYKLEKAEDYATYEQDALNCIDWLMNTPINEQKAKREKATEFLLKWLIGSPDVQIELNADIITFVESSPDLVIIFLGGWAKYSMQTKDFENKIAGSMAGIEAVIAFYTSNSEFLPKDKNIEKYIKMKESGKLKDYIEKKA